MATFTSTLTEALAPLLTPDTDPYGDHRENLTALGQLFEQIFSIVMDQGYPDDPDWVPGFGALLDVDTCPFQYLGFLSQFTGTPLPAGVDDPTARQIIRAEQGQQRGQGFGGNYNTATIPAGGAIVSAAQRNLTGTQTLILRERTAADGSPDAYHIVLYFLTAECANQAQLQADVEAQKPAGIQITYIASAGGYTWSTAIHTWSADTFTWSAAFATQP